MNHVMESRGLFSRSVGTWKGDDDDNNWEVQNALIAWLWCIGWTNDPADEHARVLNAAVQRTVAYSERPLCLFSITVRVGTTQYVSVSYVRAPDWCVLHWTTLYRFTQLK